MIVMRVPVLGHLMSVPDAPQEDIYRVRLLSTGHCMGMPENVPCPAALVLDVAAP